MCCAMSFLLGVNAQEPKEMGRLIVSKTDADLFGIDVLVKGSTLSFSSEIDRDYTLKVNEHRNLALPFVRSKMQTISVGRNSSRTPLPDRKT